MADALFKTNRRLANRVPGWLVLAAIVLATFGWRFPLLYRLPGALDEDWFAVPGWTVAREGIPRIPYAPERERTSVFYRADQMLFALPPAYFYWQAPFFWILPAGNGTARVASAVAGFIAVFLVYDLGRQIFRDTAAAIVAAALFSASRVFFFPAISSRPDMLCEVFGLAALAVAWRWRTAPERWRVAAIGVLLGLGMLTHPFALIYALQIGGWVLLDSPGWRRRLETAAILGLSAAATLGLWLPLIAMHPDAFHEQFFGNVLSRSGPGLLVRLVWPFPAMAYHAQLLWDYLGPWQFGLLALSLVAASVLAYRRKDASLRFMLLLALTACYLLVACQGIHPTKAYWIYPGALIFLVTGRLAAEASRSLFRQGRAWGWAGSLAGGALLVVVMLPGMGLRTLFVNLRHWNDPDYNAPVFLDRVLDDLPADARLVVDPAYVFDAHLAGRNVLLGVDWPFFFSAGNFSFDYVLASRYNLEHRTLEDRRGELVGTYGQRDDIFACYLEVYRALPRPVRPRRNIDAGAAPHANRSP
jgi:hypothetical protein